MQDAFVSLEEDGCATEGRREDEAGCVCEKMSLRECMHVRVQVVSSEVFGSPLPCMTESIREPMTLGTARDIVVDPRSSPIAPPIRFLSGRASFSRRRAWVLIAMAGFCTRGGEGCRGACNALPLGAHDNELQTVVPGRPDPTAFPNRTAEWSN